MEDRARSFQRKPLHRLFYCPRHAGETGLRARQELERFRHCWPRAVRAHVVPARAVPARTGPMRADQARAGPARQGHVWTAQGARGYEGP